MKIYGLALSVTSSIRTHIIAKRYFERISKGSSFKYDVMDILKLY